MTELERIPRHPQNRGVLDLATTLGAEGVFGSWNEAEASRVAASAEAFGVDAARAPTRRPPDRG